MKKTASVISSNIQTIIFVFLTILIALFPFGNILRFEISKGVHILLIEGVLALQSLVTIYLIAKDTKFSQNKLLQSVGIFVLVCTASLLINLFQYTLPQRIVSVAYIVRFMLYAQILFLPHYLTSFHQKKLATYLLFASGAFVAIGLIQYFLYPNLRNLYYLGWDEHLYRLFGSVFDPNFAGMMLVIILFLFVSYKKYALAIIAFITILLTYSRSSYVALIAGCAMYSLLHRKYKILLIGVALFAFAIGILPKNYGGEGVNLLRMSSITARQKEYHQAFTIFKDNPIIGVGFNAYRYAQYKRGYISGEHWNDTHSGAGTANSWLFVLATTGIIGFIAYCNFWKEVLIGKKILILTIFTSAFTHSMFENTLFYPFIVFLLFLIVGLTENYE